MNSSETSTATDTNESRGEQPRFEQRTNPKEAAGKPKQAAGDALSRGKEKAAKIADEQKKTAADRIGSYSSKLRESAHSWEAEDPNIAHFTQSAADRIDRVANYVRETPFSRMRQDVEEVARRHPGLFMGGMLIAGLVLGSVTRASAQNLNGMDSGDGESDGQTPRQGPENSGSYEGEDADLPSEATREAGPSYAGSPATGPGENL